MHIRTPTRAKLHNQSASLKTTHSRSSTRTSRIGPGGKKHAITAKGWYLLSPLRPDKAGGLYPTALQERRSRVPEATTHRLRNQAQGYSYIISISSVATSCKTVEKPKQQLEISTLSCTPVRRTNKGEHLHLSNHCKKEHGVRTTLPALGAVPAVRLSSSPRLPPTWDKRL